MDNKYIISDVSKILDVEPHVLRYWEEELGLNIERNQLGHRYYSNSDLEALKKIKVLKEQGLQLRAIKLMLSTPTEVPITQTTEITQASTSVEGNKLRQFEMFFKDILQENNRILKEEISEEFAARIQLVLIHQEEIEERRFRKLDETIREIQKVRQEVAVSQNKNWFFSKRKDKSL
ncbi:MAG: hypothetical protein CVU84_13845 [Firmicutes bacterium HGW-Firmicutes-1]|nr:MAG: hypothetical protein CVU84_13845 [Firmicutes bacterium HGW-Firmicutes-1]